MYVSAADIRPDADSAPRAVTIGSPANASFASGFPTLRTEPVYRVSATPADASDPAGGIVLTGRNRLGERARAMAGLFLTSGAVVALSQLDTAVSFHGV
jgi:hypothetical protein